MYSANWECKFGNKARFLILVLIHLSTAVGHQFIRPKKSFSSVQNRVDREPGLFEEISKDEYDIAIASVCSHLGLLKNHSGFFYFESHLHTLNLNTWDILQLPSLVRIAYEVPSKLERILIFQKDRPLSRKARVSVHMPSDRQVNEYIVVLNAANPTIRLVRSVPDNKRPLGANEMSALNDFAADLCHDIAEFLETYYSASYFVTSPSDRGLRPGKVYSTTNICTRNNADDNCLVAMPVSPLKINNEGPERSIVLRLNRFSSPMVQNPIDVHFKIDISDFNYSNWRLEYIWIQNCTFKSLTEFETTVQSGTIEWKTYSYKDTFQNKAQIRGFEEQKDRIPNRGRSDIPENIPIFLRRKRLKYSGWDLHMTVLRDSGIRFYNVRFQGQLILAEAGLEDTATLYQGNSPYMSHMLSLESMYGVGALLSELSPGIDCPRDAYFLSVRTIRTPNEGPITIKNGICVYTSSAGSYDGPTQRFFNFDAENFNSKNMYGAGGAKQKYIYILYVSALFNYQYAFVTVLSPTGQFTMHLLPTGYVHVDVPIGVPRGSIQFGYIAKDHSRQYMLHAHHFLFFLDVDISGKGEVAETIEIVDPDLNDSADTEIPQFHLKRTRLVREAAGSLDVLATKNSKLRICDGLAPWRCVQIVNTSPLKSAFSDEATKAFAWTRKGLWIDRYQMGDNRGSSFFNGVDLSSPDVKFADRSKNNEWMDNTDLAVWANVGFIHIPTNEDFPHTSTVYAHFSVIVKPLDFQETFMDSSIQCPRFYANNVQTWIRGYNLDKITCPL